MMGSKNGLKGMMSEFGTINLMQLDKRKWPWRKLSESLKVRSTSFDIYNCLIIVYGFMFVFVLLLFIIIQGNS